MIPNNHQWDETWVWYDGPVLFSTRDVIGRRFIGVAVTDDQTFYVQADDSQMEAFKAGTVTLRTLAAGALSLFTVNDRTCDVQPFDFDAVPDDWYPDLPAEWLPLTDESAGKP